MASYGVFRNIRHFYEFNETSFIEDITYFRKYLNDLLELETAPLQVANSASVGAGDSETYFRRYLNDIS